MKGARARLGDSELVGDYAAFHAMVLFAHKDRPPLEKKVEDMLKELGSVIDPNCPPRQEWAKSGGTKEHKKRVEHFDYAEGISQPLFFKKRPRRRSREASCKAARSGTPVLGQVLSSYETPIAERTIMEATWYSANWSRTSKGFGRSGYGTCWQIGLDAYSAETGVDGTELAGLSPSGGFVMARQLSSKKFPACMKMTN